MPLLVYRRALPPDPDVMERVFAAHDLSNGWHNGIFGFHHFHSTAREVLEIVKDEVRIAFGGPSGQQVTVRAGDVVVIPAEVAHCNMGNSADLLVVGANSGGWECNIRRSDPAEHASVMRAIAAGTGKLLDLGCDDARLERRARGYAAAATLVTSAQT